MNNFVPNKHQGLVVSHFGAQVAVEAEDGQIFQCQLHRNQTLPVVGDQVAWELTQHETGVITAIMPRRSLLARGDGHGKMKPIAANIDLMVIVMAPPPIFSEYLIDRYLVAAELLKIEPMIVLNKIDLLDENTAPAAYARLAPYQRIPYSTVLSSVVQAGTGLVDLAASLTQKTAVLLGPSGVGKSSIIAALSENEIRIGDVSMKGIGKHTTTATRLYHLPQGGQLIDSPGVREFALWPVERQALLSGFKEFAPFTAQCKFRNCQHVAEPGCAVQAAIAAGNISPIRFENYCTLLKEKW
ncbi:MAG TPA: ribosome small subunit-dependent GTPase A [Gammaproteobacteria bacterium]|jgi:ribosome biogenesis GTPase|nr:ribosome small subunit-dependent GTPase A [Gammaproteobacteria bacterium]